MNPPARVSSQEKLLAIALAWEMEAARQYCGLADWAARRELPDLARLFEQLAAMKETHGAAVQNRASRLLGRLVDASAASGKVPPVFEDAVTQPDQLTPYRALAIAVRNEERAFAFFAYAAAEARDPGVKELAEDLAREQLEHAAALRSERRRAFRDEPPPFGVLPRDTAALAEMSGVWEQEAEGASAPARRSVLLERNFDRYLSIAERSKDEAVVAEAQRRAQGTVRRLALGRGTATEG